jgi:hypothetical protein
MRLCIAIPSAAIVCCNRKCKPKGKEKPDISAVQKRRQTGDAVVPKRMYVKDGNKVNIRINLAS